MYEIETVDVPVDAGKRGRKAVYPLSELAVGESFFVPTESSYVQDSVRAAASYRGKRLGRKFCCRSMDGGIRVWRLA